MSDCNNQMPPLTQMAKDFAKNFAQPTKEQSEVAELIAKVDKLISMIEQPSSIIMTGKRVIEEYEMRITRKVR